MSSLEISLEIIWLIYYVSFITQSENRHGKVTQSRLIRPGKRIFMTWARETIKMHGAFVEERFTRWWPAAPKLPAMPGEISSFSVQSNALDTIYCELLRLFSTLFPFHPQPSWRDTGHIVHTVLPDTFSGIAVMQSLKVKHDVIIRRDILRGFLASFLRGQENLEPELQRMRGLPWDPYR